MRKNKKIFLLSLSTLVIPSVFISCNEAQKITIEKELNEQIYNKDQFLFLKELGNFYKKGETVLISENNFQEKYLENISDFNVLFNNAYNLDSLALQLSKNKINSIKKDFFNGNFYVKNIQLALLDIISHIDKYYSIFPNLIKINNMRMIGFINNEEQINYLEKILTFYFKAYKFNGKSLKRVNIQPLNSSSNKLYLQISFYDQDDKLIFENSSAFLFDFFNYNRASSFPTSFKLEIPDQVALFNEQVQSFNIALDNNLLGVRDVEDLLENGILDYKMTAKGFLALLEQAKDYFKVSVPNYINSKYTFKIDIENSSSTNLLNNSNSINKIYLNKFDKNGNLLDNTYLYSIDFSSHKHLFNGYKTSIDNDDLFDLYHYNSYEKDEQGNMIGSSQISYSDFKNILINNLDLSIEKLSSKVAFWGKKQSEIDPYEFYYSNQNQLLFLNWVASTFINGYLINFDMPGELFEPLIVEFSDAKINQNQAGIIDVNVKIKGLKNKLTYDEFEYSIKGFKGFSKAK
ncbi:MAG3240 family lipoprotein [Mycoplasmopsis gallinacea]|uniref:Lipoprotein n=1 Tax=Mycoplasmopsis gallinacea TaxID=29556 RepID=A0A6H0V6I6_9BACT|nr:hypothetical protein [Mycoplasmopsis gallinacea]QIW62115.1 hypothetical protein GOQ20_01475 [Mycoplasmopsis gallinacea]